MTADEISLFLTKISDFTLNTFLDKIKWSEPSDKQLLSFTDLTNNLLKELRQLLIFMITYKSTILFFL